jgi:CheY-like chemotaxis protein
MSSSRAPKRRKTVLIIIDDHDKRVRLRKSCEERHGLHVETAANAKEGLELLRKWEAPDFILLSSDPLPLMSYEEFLDAKSKDPKLAKVPVVLVSQEPVVPLPRTVAGEVFAPVSNKDLAVLTEQFCSE